MSDAASGQAATDTATTQATDATQTADTASATASASTAAAGTEAAQATTAATDAPQPNAGDKPADSSDKPVDDQKPAGAPEKYEFKFADGEKPPSEGVLKSFEDTARTLGMTNEAAQAVLDKVLPAMRADGKSQLEAFYADIGGMPETWADQVKADKDIGGTKLDDTLAVAAKARDTFGGPALTHLLNKTGLGNHPEIIRAFAKVGRAISADSFVDGRAATSDTRTAAERLYPTKS